MSYILDALRKADAQRERDPARGIHAQPLRGSGTTSPASGLSPWLWGSAAIGVAALATAGWYLYPDKGAGASKVANSAEPASTRRPGTSPQPVPVSAPVAGTAVLPPVAAPVPVVATAIEPPAPIARPVTPPTGESRVSSAPMMRGNQRTGAPDTSAPPVVTQLPAGISPPAATPTPAYPQAGVPAPGTGAVNAPVPAGAPAAATAPGMTPAPVPAAPQPVPTPPPQPPAPTPAPFRPPPPPPPLPPAPPAPPAQPVAGLPADAPKLVITGGVYSTNPVQRMLIVNGQVLNEGSEVASGVVLEEIKPKGAVLRFRGARYTVNY